MRLWPRLVNPGGQEARDHIVDLPSLTCQQEAPPGGDHRVAECALAVGVIGSEGMPSTVDLYRERATSVVRPTLVHFLIGDASPLRLSL